MTDIHNKYKDDNGVFKNPLKTSVVEQPFTDDHDVSVEDNILDSSAKYLVSPDDSTSAVWSYKKCLWVIPVLHVIPALIVTVCM